MAPGMSTATTSPVETAGQVACYHCGLDCPDRSYTAGEKVFCCNGCLTVFELLEENGLTRFYEGLGSGLSEIAIDPESLSVRSLGDGDVLATGVERGVSSRTGKSYTTHSAWVWTVRDGVVTHMRAFHDTAAMHVAMT